MFVQDADEHLEALKGMVGSDDLEAGRQTAHTLKGSAANLGADQVRELATTLEVACQEGDTEALAGLVPQVRAAVDAVRRQGGDLGLG